MNQGFRLNECFASIVVTAIVVGLSGSSSAASTEQGLYVGSKTCSGCHVSEANSWSQTLHSRMMRTLEEDAEIGVIDLAAARPPFSTDRVAYVLGNMRKLLFLEKKGNGFVVMPHQYNLIPSQWEPLNVDQWDHFFGPSSQRKSAAAKPLNWNDRCAGCHTTGYDPTAGTFSELSIACESCHGPGGTHAASTKRDDIVNPAALRGERANHVCAQCHARGIDTSGRYPYPVGFKPGNDLSEHFVLAQPLAGQNSDLFWGNGMARRHHAQYNELVQSKHFQNGLHCFDCHEVHAFRPVLSSPETRLIAHTERFLLKKRARFICFKCHTTRETEFATEKRGAGGKIIDQHTHHPTVITQTVRHGEAAHETHIEMKKMHCGDCHMPREHTGAASYDIRAHTFKVPNPRDTITFGAPNGCGDCHSKEGAEWAAQWISAWRGQRPGPATSTQK